MILVRPISLGLLFLPICPVFPTCQISLPGTFPGLRTDGGPPRVCPIFVRTAEIAASQRLLFFVRTSLSGRLRLRLILVSNPHKRVRSSFRFSYVSPYPKMSNSSRRNHPASRNGRGTSRARPIGRDLSERQRRRIRLLVVFLSSRRPSGRPLERRCSSRTFRYGYLVTT